MGMRMNGANEETLVRMCWQAFIAYHADFKQNEALENAVKEQEQRIAEFLKSKSQGAQSILAKMHGATDSGLCHEVFQGWLTETLDQKKEAQLAAELHDAHGRFKNIIGKNKMKAEDCMERAQTQGEITLLLEVFNAWKLDAMMDASLRMHHGKIDAKRQQLVGVQQMFRSFANQLEKSIKEGSTGDTNYDLGNVAPRKHGIVRTDAQRSLPDIHGKGVTSQPNTPKQNSSSRRTPKPNQIGSGGRSPDMPPASRAAWG